MISGRISKLVSKVQSFFGRKPRVQEREPITVDFSFTTPSLPVRRRKPTSRKRGRGAVGLEAKVLKVERQRRVWLRSTSRMSPLLPPPAGHRRAEFSSSVAGQWTRALMLMLALLLPSLASAQSLAPQVVDDGVAGVGRPSVHDAARTPSSAFPITAIILGNLGDAISTELALRNSHVREGNPVMGQSRAQRLAVKAAGTALQVWIVGRIGKEHPKLAKVVGYSAGAFFGGVTVWNSTRTR